MTKADKPKEPVDPLFEATFKRPPNFFRLSQEAQWAIDKELGLLDWDGRGLTKAQQRRFKDHYL